MACKFTLWDPNLGNVPLPTALIDTLAAGVGTTITLDQATGIITITAETLVEDFASPPPLGDVAPNTVAATTLSATHKATLNTVQLAGLTATQLAVLATVQMAGLTATQLAVTGATTLVTTQVGGLTDTQISNLTTLNVSGNTVLHTTQVTGLTVTSLGVHGTVVANGASQVSVTLSGITATSLVLLTLKTVGGTVGAVPAVKTITPGAGFTVVATAGDTSTYNYGVLG